MQYTDTKQFFHYAKGCSLVSLSDSIVLLLLILSLLCDNQQKEAPKSQRIFDKAKLSLALLVLNAQSSHHTMRRQNLIHSK